MRRQVRRRTGQVKPGLRQRQNLNARPQAGRKNCGVYWRVNRRLRRRLQCARHHRLWQLLRREKHQFRHPLPPHLGLRPDPAWLQSRSHHRWKCPPNDWPRWMHRGRPMTEAASLIRRCPRILTGWQVSTSRQPSLSASQFQVKRQKLFRSSKMPALPGRPSSLQSF
jgi:hypothetical protein